MESHGISWNLHLKGMGARELGSKVIAKTIDAESYSVYIYIYIFFYLFIYIFILFIYLFILKKILYNYTILQVIPHASGYRLELPTLSVCWVPLARPSFHRSVHMHPLRNVHYSVL